MTRTRRRWLAALALVALALLLFVALRPATVAPDSIERLPAYHDPALLRRAWSLPVARRYGPAGYVYQRNPSVCGPTSIADLLRSLGRQATPAAVLAGSGIPSYFGLLPGGLTLDQEAMLLRRRGAPATVVRAASLAQFRATIARANDPHVRLIANFTRAPLFGRGHGHFSPILGYLADRDLVFVGDVNDSYRPWLAPVARLYAAVDTIDPATHAKRGVIEVAVR